jgi:ApaG protein
MVSAITGGIKVGVDSNFLSESSSPDKGEFLFSYDITITNQNDFSIQLLKRHWTIYDSLFPKREVVGEGVIGEKPILLPGEIYSYQSFCDLRSNVGWMEGSYLFRKEDSEELIQAAIPRFELMTPAKMN